MHKFLGVKTAYKDWIRRMLEYAFVEGTDYVVFTEKVAAQKRARTYEQVDHALKLDMAYGFVENTDFATVVKNVYRADGSLMPTQHQTTANPRYINILTV